MILYNSLQCQRQRPCLYLTIKKSIYPLNVQFISVSVWFRSSLKMFRCCCKKSELISNHYHLTFTSSLIAYLHRHTIRGKKSVRLNAVTKLAFRQRFMIHYTLVIKAWCHLGRYELLRQAVLKLPRAAATAALLTIKCSTEVPQIMLARICIWHL